MGWKGQMFDCKGSITREIGFTGLLHVSRGKAMRKG